MQQPQLSLVLTVPALTKRPCAEKPVSRTYVSTQQRGSLLAGMLWYAQLAWKLPDASYRLPV